MAKLTDTISISIEVSGIEEFERAVSEARESLMGAMHPGTGIAGAIVGAMEKAEEMTRLIETSFANEWRLFGIPISVEQDLFSRSAVLICGKCGRRVTKIDEELFMTQPDGVSVSDAVLRDIKSSLEAHVIEHECPIKLPWVEENPPQPTVRKIRFRSKRV